MVSIAAVVDAALRAANVPIIGVALGDPLNRATWTVLFVPTATPADRATAATILTTVAVDAATLSDLDAISDVDQKVLKALVLGLWELVPAPTMTKAQLRTRILAIWKGL